MSDTSLTPLRGGCLCGAVRHRLLSPPSDSGYRHCSLCLRASGPPVPLFATVPWQHMQLLSATPKRYRSPSTGERWSCRDCGTQRYMQVDSEPATTDFTVASRDAPEGVPPSFHIRHGARIAWFDTDDALQRFDKGRPADGWFQALRRAATARNPGRRRGSDPSMSIPLTSSHDASENSATRHGNRIHGNSSVARSGTRNMAKLLIR